MEIVMHKQYNQDGKNYDGIGSRDPPGTPPLPVSHTRRSFLELWFWDLALLH